MSAIQKLLTEHIDVWTAADTEKKSGRGRSSGNAASVYGIKKLRELILELAVRGKLVTQDPTDEPAFELLKRILKEKAKLVTEGKIKKGKSTQAISEEEKPFELPKNWEWSSLASIAQVNPRNNADDSLPSSFVSMTMIGSRFDSSHEQEVRLWGEIKQGFTHFAEGDIGIAKITPCFENSKACVFSGLKNRIGAGTTELHVVRPINSTLDPRFVLVYLKSPQFMKVGETKMTGTAGQKRLPKDFVESNQFPLPPLTEQHRIVTKVDELMALCDQLEAQHINAAEAHEKLVSHLLGTLTQSQNAADFSDNWQRIAGHFDTLFTTEASIDVLKQTLLQLAVMGKLVPQDPKDEPANELLKRIQAKKTKMVAEGVIKKLKSLPPITEEEKLFELPKNWSWARLGDLSEIKGGKRLPAGTTFAFEKTPYIYIQVTNMKEGTIIDESLKYIDEETRNVIKQYVISSDDLYITIAGTIGDVGTVPEHFDGMNLTENAAKIIFRISDREWLKHYLRSPLSRNQFYNKTIQMAQPKLALHRISDSIVALPPIAEQRRIVAKVDELMALCDQVKSRLTHANQLQQKFADVILQQSIG